MEVYVLDSLLRRTAVVDIFESLIWTERFAEIGDFELFVESTPAHRLLFTAGTRIAINESYRVMTVETVEDTISDDERKILKLKGRSLEAYFEDRVLYDVYMGYRRKTAWSVLDETAATMVRYWYQSICVYGSVHPSDVIPFAQEDVYLTLYPPDTIPESTEKIALNVEPQSLYKAFKLLLDPYDLGFRLYRNPFTSQLYFNVYSGSDRTSSQTQLPPVIFAQKLETLQNSTMLTSIEKAKNVCYVDSESGGYQSGMDFYPGSSVNVYQDDSSPEVEGFDRRAMHIDAGRAPSEIEARGQAAIEAWMIQRGKDALVEQRPFKAFDGEIPQYGQHKYQVHYNLGDLVEMRSEDGITNKMRVTEQIFVSDSDGDRSYPTLAIELFINAGAWNSWKYNKVWADMGATEFWANQPD